MKKHVKNFLPPIILLLMLVSCEIDISVDLPRPVEKLVVEAYIVNGENPYVFLTKNAGYFDVVDSSTLINMMVFNESTVVTISDGTQRVRLYPAFIPQFPYFGYTCDNMTGEVGRQYRLDVSYNDKKYFAYTSIPQPVVIDSVWFNLLSDHDSLGYISFAFQDPPQPGNCYALHTMVEFEQLGFLKPYFGSHISDDLYDNGNKVVFNFISKGAEIISFFENNDETDEEFLEAVAYGKNTNVLIRLSSIDVEHYKFWNSYYRHMITWGNPFTNPATILTNIQGDPAQGFFGGYGTNIVKVHITDSATIELIQ